MTTRDERTTDYESPPETGELHRLGKYRIQRLLGKGGMGAVYLAHDERLGRPVALKVMLPHAAADRAARERFLREARAAARVVSDHVVAVYEAEEVGDTPYLAMQYLPGESLEAALRRAGPPGIAEAVRIGREAALGLAAAHARGLVHRDLKPANLWLEAPHGRVKLLDFGLAKPVDDAEITASGQLLGTPAYMAPEQARGETVDARADLFSLGGVLYRIVTGRPPFARPTVPAVLLAITQDEPADPTLLNPAVPPALAGLLRRLLAKQPADRPASATAVAEELGVAPQ